MLHLKNPEQITGLKDHDLIDNTPESDLFHQQNDLKVLLGNTVKGIHQAAGPYGSSLYYFVKKPLFDHANHISGIIYQCNEFTASNLVSNILEFDRQQAVAGTLPVSLHYRIGPLENSFKLSTRELECLFFTLRGKSAKQIGEIMQLSKRTIESYIESIKNKAGCQNKADLLVLAVSQGYMNFIPPQFLQYSLI